ncbi:hypothetical protein SCB49_04340 [unidentified eubacterium SCB49]|nr:hypothetical protein SCB49_04340 [unidentified eubacterium SCB49]
MDIFSFYRFIFEKMSLVLIYLTRYSMAKDIIKEALEFEVQKTSFKTTSERIHASRKAKEMILGVNEVYKETKDPELMDLMKRLTAVKQKIEKRLKGRSLTA